MELICAVQKYSWGKLGEESAVARLSAAHHVTDTPSSPSIDPNTPYAELWMGTHPNGPSHLVVPSADQHQPHHPHQRVLLADWIERNAECLGQHVVQRFGSRLPFLFKVLSVRTALSIQAHPAKAHAEELHRLRPDLYKDANHKPEMAIALTEFHALCGFRPLHQIKILISGLTELRSLIGQGAADDLVSADSADCADQLKRVFSALMTADSHLVKQSMTQLLNRLESDRASVSESVDQDDIDLFLRLHGQYPSDVGCFGALFLNHICLQPGESLFLAPNLPHAYLSGDCVECMACSDNVVRAGLTPKHRDVETLLSMLEYSCSESSQLLFRPEPEQEHVQLYRPPVPDFAVSRVQCCGSAVKEQYLDLVTRQSASVIICINGSAECHVTASSSPPLPSAKFQLTSGSVIFVLANQNVRLQIDSQSELLLYQAFCPSELGD